MLTIRIVGSAEALAAFCEHKPLAGMTPAQRQTLWAQRGLFALAVEEDGDLVGLSLAESGPKAVHVIALEGDTGACGLLLDRLMRLSGERDVSAWCPDDRPDLLAALEERGFLRQSQHDFPERAAHFYYLPRNDS